MEYRYGNSCGLLHIFWYAERVCKVIGAARRDVSYWYIYLALLHAGHYLVECAISAAAHYKVILLSIFPDLFYGISLTLCRIMVILYPAFVMMSTIFTKCSFMSPLPDLGLNTNKSFFFIYLSSSAIADNFLSLWLTPDLPIGGSR